MKKLILSLLVLSAASTSMARESNIRCIEQNSTQPRTVLLLATNPSAIRDGEERIPYTLQVFNAKRSLLLTQTIFASLEDVSFQFKGKTVQGRNRIIVSGHIYLDEMDQAGLRLNINGLRSGMDLSCDYL